ncbi:MAG: M20/M25/M40 family metallo-hydrolase [Spirochaetota bacterium]
MSTSAGKAAKIIEDGAGSVIALGERLRSTPEPGFREWKTAEILAGELASLGAEVERGLALTGLRASVGPVGAPEIVLVADMDALLTAGAENGIAHSCGHSAQMAATLAAFRALVQSGLPRREGVRLVFLGAPAEEYTELDYRLGLRKKGDILLFSGKQELIRLGAFERATAVVKYHSMPDEGSRLATVNGTLNGFVGKRATFLGKAAHAGAWPEQGINALNAAAIAQLAIHSQRETFRDEDHIRVHPILREGGTVVNTVPDRAVLETYVRGASFDAILDASAKVDRALAAGAVAVGARVLIEDLPGYQPFSPSPELGAILGRATLAHIAEASVDFHDHSFASDDIGDVASIVPTCQFSCSGFRGSIHGADFEPSDLYRAYVLPALIIADTVEALAAEGGRAALDAHAAFKPRFTRDEYVRAILALFSERSLFWDPKKASSPPFP